MELVEYLRGSYYTNFYRIYLKPDIPPEALRNALTAHGMNVPIDDVLVLVDDTMMGSGKDGCLVCRQGISFREAFADPRFFPFDQLRNITYKGKAIFADGQRVIKLNMPEEKEIQGLFMLIHDWLVQEASGEPDEPTAASQANDPSESQMLSVLDATAAFVNKNRIPRTFIRPNIPPKKLKAAIGSYGFGMAPEDVVILIDDTIMGGAAEGALLTSQRIAIKALFGEPLMVPLRTIDNIVMKGRDVHVDSQVRQLTQATEKEIGPLFKFLNSQIQEARRRAAESIVSVAGPPLLRESSDAPQNHDTVQVRLETTAGHIVLQLDGVKAPKTVENFVRYVRDGHYDGLLFHRVIPKFMIQGGGYDSKMKERATRAPIPNEGANGLKNVRGSVAMARSSKPDSATSQFFINHADSAFLDHPGQDGHGYAVFGMTIEGMEVVDRIASTKTGNLPPFGRDVPLTPVVIKKATVVESADRVGPELVTAPSDLQFGPPPPSPILSTSEPAIVAAGDAEAKADVEKKKIADAILDWAARNREPIVKMLREQAGDLSLRALRDEESMKSFAVFLYGLLPVVLRVVVKEHVFVQFVLNNRVKLLEKLQLGALASAQIALQASVEARPAEAPQPKRELAAPMSTASEPRTPPDEARRAAFATMIAVQRELKKLINDDPDFNIHIELAIAILHTTVMALMKVVQGSQEEMEFQLLTAFSVGYGTTFQSITSSLKQLDNVKKVYLIGYALALSTYEERGLSEEGSEALEILPAMVGAPMASSDRDQCYNAFVNAYTRIGVQDQNVAIDVIQKLSAFGEKWSQFFFKLSDVERWRIWRKWSDFANQLLPEDSED